MPKQGSMKIWIRRVLSFGNFLLFTSLFFLLFTVGFFFVLKKDMSEGKDFFSIELVDTTTGGFSFYIASDMREYAGEGKFDTTQYFRGAVEAMDAIDGKFLIVPGDLDPVTRVSWTIDQYLGEDFVWYPVVGNHELPSRGKEAYKGENIELIRKFELGDVKAGPAPCEETTYSFDYENSHFVVLNQYCDTNSDIASDGDMPDLLYSWLESDLKNNAMLHTFVIGHEPAYVQPDADSARLRHKGDSLDQHPENRDRFWGLLDAFNVDAYLCGHTHNYSTFQKDGVWQIDAGHARGIGDLGAKSTFLKIDVTNEEILLKTYRYETLARKYVLTESKVLN